MNKYFFYKLPASIWNEYSQKIPALLLECQPYLKDRYYRVVSLQDIEIFKPFVCEDKGRTEGWFQCFLGSGIYNTGKKIKLPKSYVELIHRQPVGTITVRGKFWVEILESWVQKLNSDQIKLGEN